MRSALAGRQLLGSYSRLGFDHPGPLHFYLLAPFYAAGGARTAALNLGTLSIHACAAFGMVLLIARASGALAAACSALVLAALVVALGPAFIAFWDPTLAMTPTLLCYAALAAFAAGRSWALPVAAFGAVIAVHAHLSLVPPIVVAACIAIVLRRRFRASAPAARSKTAIKVALGLLVVLSLPPLVQQFVGEPGNVTRILTTLGRDGERPSWSEAFGLAIEHTSAVARAVFGVGASWAELAAAVQVLATIAAFVIARRERRHAIAATAAIALGVLAIAPLALTRAVGGVQPHMLLWIDCAGAFAWLPVLATIATSMGRKNRTAGAVTSLLLAVTIGWTAWTATKTLLAGTFVLLGDPEIGAMMRGQSLVVPRVASRLAELEVRRVTIETRFAAEALPQQQAFVIDAGLTLALIKRGLTVEPDPAHAWAFPALLGAAAGDARTARVIAFDAQHRASVEAAGGTADVFDLGAFGVAIRMP